MADPGTKAIVLCRIHAGDSRPDFFHPFQKIAAYATVNVLSWRGREEPRGTAEKIGIGEFDARVFFACHWVPSKETAACVRAEDVKRACHHLPFCASYIGQKSARRKNRSQTFDEINDGAHGRGQQNDLAAASCVGRIGMPCVNRPPFASAL